MEDKKKEEGINKITKYIEIANKNPNKLNEEGKRNLAHDIIEEISIEELTEFLNKKGYNR